MSSIYGTMVIKPHYVPSEENHEAIIPDYKNDSRLKDVAALLREPIGLSCDLKKEEPQVKRLISAIRLYSETGFLNVFRRIWQAVLAIFGQSHWQASVKFIESKSEVIEGAKGVMEKDPLSDRVAAELLLKTAILCQKYKLLDIDSVAKVSREGQKAPLQIALEKRHQALNGLVGDLKGAVVESCDFQKEKEIKSLTSSILLYSGAGFQNFFGRVWQAVLAIFGKSYWQTSLRVIESRSATPFMRMAKALGGPTFSDRKAAGLLLEAAVLVQSYKIGKR